MTISWKVIGILLWFGVFCSANASAANRHALLIGIADYAGTGLASLDGTYNDVQLIAKILSDKRFGFEDNITVLRDAEATHSKLEVAFAVLSQQLEPGDFVYIHYSGHGSFTRDLNGDEYSGLDQTWVSYKSRHPDAHGIDAFDILDDELNSWLVPIFDKAVQVVLVSDSCHSGSVTRGSSVKTRAAPLDDREHPLGRKTFLLADLKEGVTIGAAGDDESAGEFRANNGQIYGLFTWYWGESLLRADEVDSWQDLFMRTSVQVSRERRTQTPQIMGEKIREKVFGGGISSPVVKIPVKQVFGALATIPVGSLSGVTVGSVYRKYDSNLENLATHPTLIITSVDTFFSTGRISGDFLPGDLLVEKTHAYELDPMLVYVAGDLAESEGGKIIHALKGMFGGIGMPGYQLTDTQQQSNMVLYLLFPKLKNEQLVYSDAKDSLPKSFAGQSAEVWILTATEDLWHENLRIDFTDIERGKVAIKKSMRQISRIREVKGLSSISEMEIDVAVHIWHQAEICDAKKDDCLKYETTQGDLYFLLQETYPAEDLSSRQPAFNDLLTFTFKNNTPEKLYFYLLDISPSGEISVIFPPASARREDALVIPKKSRHTASVDQAGMQASELGEESIKLIVSKKSLDISILEQAGYKHFRATRGENNPLENLLVDAIYGTRGSGMSQPVRKNEWCTKEYSFIVGD